MKEGAALVALLLVATLAAEAQNASIWSGVFTAEQAKRGNDAYQASCSACHGSDLHATDPEAADLTGPAAGHALDIAVREPVKIAFASSRAMPKGRAIHARSFLVAPSRPGRALRQAAARRVPVA